MIEMIGNHLALTLANNWPLIHAVLLRLDKIHLMLAKSQRPALHSVYALTHAVFSCPNRPLCMHARSCSVLD